MAASVAVVTKRAGLTLTMNSASHRFTEVRPVGGWLERRWIEQVIVLDLESAEASLAAMETLTTSGVTVPVVIIATDADGWDELLSLYPDLSLVSLPIMPAALLSAVDRAVRRSRVDSAATVAVAAPAAAPLAAEPGPGHPSEQLPEPRPQVDQGPAEPPPPPSQRAEVPLAARGEVDVTSEDEVGLQEEPAPTLTEHRPVMNVVRSLQGDIFRLGRVPEVAELLRQHCASAVACDASAVLVPDGDVWRVSAGDHLRPLEKRLQISSGHWLVTEVVEAGHGLLIKNTDIARTQLSGSPLASWPNLLALPVADARALLLLARQDKSFNRKDLTRARQEVGSFGSQLADALDVRRLARKMIEFVDLVD